MHIRIHTMSLLALTIPMLLGCSPRDNEPAASDASIAASDAQGAATTDATAAVDSDMHDPSMTEPMTGTETAADASQFGTQDPMTQDGQAASPADMPGSAASFYRTALASGTAEAELSRYAVANAKSTQVRDLAQMLVRDHDAVNAKLRAASGMDAPAPDPQTKAEGDAVKAMQGDGFDRAFLDHMAKGHAKSIALYQRAANDSTDAKASTLAKETLPRLREHAAMVTKLQGTTGAAAKP